MFNMVLMCKDVPVYDIENEIILNEDLIPGAIKRKTLSFGKWFKLRYSSGSNSSARRLMLRAFGSDNHEQSLKATRALSLSDCYWIKELNEEIYFNDITPYLNKEWDGVGKFKGGAISTLFANGDANKMWLNNKTLVKYNSEKEVVPYQLANLIGIKNISSVKLNGADLHISNFTSVDIMLETLEQSGKVSEKDIPLEIAVNEFGKKAVELVVLDYLTESDDRHWGNLGFLRCTKTGEYLGMAPFYDFDWCWTDNIVPLPKNAVEKYSGYIFELCEKAIIVSEKLEKKYSEIVLKRANELKNEI